MHYHKWVFIILGILAWTGFEGSMLDIIRNTERITQIPTSPFVYLLFLSSWAAVVWLLIYGGLKKF